MNGRKDTFGRTGRLAEYFIDSKLTPLIIIVTLVMGIMAIVMTPKEDEPSIKIALAEVFLAYPGHGAQDIDERLAQPVAAWIREIPTIKHVVSASSEHGVMFTVEFRDGVEREKALTQLYDRLNANLDLLPPGAGAPVVKPRSRDDVPSLAVTLWSDKADTQVLRKVAAEMATELQCLPNVSRVDIIGGQTRALLVELDAGKLAERGIGADWVVQAIQGANLRLPAGTLSGPSGVYNLESGSFLKSASDAGLIIVGANATGPVYLRDVAVVKDDVSEPANYVSRIGYDTRWSAAPAVTLAVTKVDRSNVTEVTRAANAMLVKLSKELLPGDIHMSITRDAGRTAETTLDKLSLHMVLAVFVAVLLVVFALGWREGIVTAITLAVTLVSVPIIYNLTGFTLNRISISAMVFAIGLLIDNAIVIIENIDRHWHGSEIKGAHLAALAVQEVGPPTILATLMVICALVPTAFVTGSVGQYMRPLPVGSALGMLFSLFVALSVTPFLYYRFLSSKRATRKSSNGKIKEAIKKFRLRAGYLRLLGWLMESRWRIFGTYALAIITFIGVLALVPLRVAQVKLMPDNDADEISIMVDLPSQTQLEDTQAALTDVARTLKAIPEVTACNVYAGTSAPLTFQGLARDYDYRVGSNQAEIQVQIVPEAKRHRSSHAIALQMRDLVSPLLSDKDTVFTVAEAPPGSPVLAPMVAEVYGPDDATRLALAGKVMDLFKSGPGVRDVTWTARPGAKRLRYEVDPQKAGMRGVAAAQAAATVRTLFAGDASAWVNMPEEREPVPFMIRLARPERAGEEDILSLAFTPLTGGAPVPATEIGTLERLPGTFPLLRKDMQPVIMVTGVATGLGPVPTSEYISKILEKERVGGQSIQVLWSEDNPDVGRYAVRWGGEWTHQRDMFGDLGKAFMVVLFLIYCLLVGWYRSFLIPIVIMLPIPLIAIGVIPAHVILGKAMGGPGTMGVIALAGIVIRNSILLVDFARSRIASGMPIKEAVLQACEMRSRPIILTALAVILGEAVLYLDPILQGIGITLPAGALVSTLLTLGIVPLAYYQLDSFLHAHGRALEQHDIEPERI